MAKTSLNTTPHWKQILIALSSTTLRLQGLRAITRNNLKAFSALSLVFLSSCGSGNVDTRTLTEPGTDLDSEPLAQMRTTMVSLPDPSAEYASAAGHLSPTLIDAQNSPLGLSTPGDCKYSNSDIAASQGKWKFELAPQCSILQVSQDDLEQGQAIVLEFDIQNTSDYAVQTRADIVGIDASGNTSLISSKLIEVPANTQGWLTKQTSSGFNKNNEYASQTLAVRFTNESTYAALSVDTISLKVFHQDSDKGLVFHDTWDAQCDQLWAGKHFWSNRLQDWQIHNGRLQTRDPNQYRPNRTTHRISTEMSSAPADFSLTVETGSVENSSTGSYSGFLIGAGSRMDYRSSALIHNRHGHNGGLIAGIDDNGNTFFLDHDKEKTVLARGNSMGDPSSSGRTVHLIGTYLDSGLYRLKLTANDYLGMELSSSTIDVEAARLLGNIAIVSNPGNGNTAHWFDNWKGSGSKLREQPSKHFGPVLFASYTVDRNVLTVNAQYPPICTNDQPTPTLEILEQGQWKEISSAAIDPLSYTARFSVSNWEPTANTEYRVVTQSKQDSSENEYFTGIIKYIPTLQDELTIGLYNCRPGIINSNVEGWIQQNNEQAFTWTRDRIVFPHEELLENSQKHNPDVIAFLGDQIYEFDPNGLVVKQMPELSYDYLWKWYQFGWSVRELMRNTPSFVLPDDHDVFQSNVWGQGGGIAPTEQLGGYVYPAEFINIVQRTQTGSLPSPFDATPVEQGISVYYTDIVMGGVGMAILEDRKFKTAPHANQDSPQLLGNRQLDFLEQWATDWEGQSMKIALSQSPFSQSTTHSGKHFDLIRKDQDSNGWPKIGRDRAVHQLRKAYAPHLSGDQHLGLTLKHGLDEYDDAVYSFAAPSMLNIFPRIWDPLNNASGKGNRDNSPLGQHTDKHNNRLTVLAVANPEVYYQPFEVADTPSKNELGIGYGIVRINTSDRRYTFEAWPANVDPFALDAKPYANWPVTVNQTDNDGRPAAGFLTPRIADVAEPVVQVFNEADNLLVYARRYPSASVDLPVFDSSASYRVVLSNPATGYREEFTQQRIQ